MGVVQSCLFDVGDHIDYALVQVRGKRNCGVARLMYPMFFIDKPLTSDEIEGVKLSWDYIMLGTSSEFEKQTRSDPDFPYRSCEEWFQIIFYERLFDVHPVSYSFCFLFLMFYIYQS